MASKQKIKGINRTSGFYWNPANEEVQGVYSPLVRVLVKKKHQQEAPTRISYVCK